MLSGASGICIPNTLLDRMLLAVVAGISILRTLGVGRTGRMGDIGGMLLQKLRIEGVKQY